MVTEATALPGDEVDLRQVLVILLEAWKWILLSTALGVGLASGITALQTPLYEATAVIAIDQSGTPISTKPVNWLLSEELQGAIAERLAVQRSELPRVTVRSDPADATTFRIVVHAEDPLFAARVANLWAEAGIDWFRQHALSAASVEAARAAVEQAENALQGFLEEERLTGLSYASLTQISGVGECSAVVGTEPSSPPTLSAGQRLQLAGLMLEVEAARAAYTNARSALEESRAAYLAHPPILVARAEPPSSPFRPKTAINLGVGGGMGLMLGVFVVLVIRWWHTPATSGAHTPRGSATRGEGDGASSQVGRD